MTLATDPVLYDAWALLAVILISLVVALLVKHKF